MKYAIENKTLQAEIDAVGAELRMLRRKADGHDYIWSGDPAVWGGTAPILFPFVGRLKSGFYRYEGVQYPMEKHGFARKATFTLSEKSESAVELALESTPETLAVYPFPFLLKIRFSLEGNRLTATHTVKNTGDKPMWFSLGAHPGFAADIGDLLRFEQAEQVQAYRLKNDLLGDAVPFLKGESVWQIGKDSFVGDAYILEKLSSKSIMLERKKADSDIRFRFDAPYLGIWAKPAAPYVCLEPWYGVDDPPAHDHELTNKKAIQALPPDETFTLSYTIETL